MRINQNVAAFNAYRNLSATGGQLSKSLEKLSSGFRINRAADDAAGLVKSESLRAEIGGTRQAIQNAQDGVSFVQTAEGALNEVHAILQRMRDLAVSASNTATSDGVAQQSEIVELRKELQAIGQRTTFAGAAVFQNYSVGTVTASSSATTTTQGAAGVNEVQNVQVTAAGGTFTLTHGANTTAAIAYNASAADVQTALEGLASIGAGNVSVTGSAGNWNIEFIGTKAATDVVQTTVDGSGLTSSTSTAMTFHIGAGSGVNHQLSFNTNIKIDTASVVPLFGVTLDTIDVDTNAEQAIADLDTAIGNVGKVRSTLGATQNRLEHTITNLNVAAENLAASESRIRDADMALEMVTFTRHQIMSQAGTAMLAQANQVPQAVLQLLR